MHVFKVWCSLKEKKKSVASGGMADLLEKVKAKFTCDNIRIVLEEDGTEVDDDDVLLTFKEKTLMVLKDGEEWSATSIIDTSLARTPQSFMGTPDTPRAPPRSRPLWNPTTSSTPRKTGEWSKNFKVQWNKLQPANLQKLEASVGREKDPKAKLLRSELSELMRMVVPELRVLDKYPGKIAFKNVAESMIADFKVLADLDEDGNVIGSGISTVALKLHEHNNYLNRPSKTATLMALATSRPSANGKRKRNPHKSQSKCGTRCWQPDHPEKEDESSLKEKQKWLQLESKKNQRDRDNGKVQDFMTLTYSSQRLYLNTEEPTVKEVKEQWPLLLEDEHLFKHSEKLISEFDRDIEYLSSHKLKKVLVVIEETAIVDKAKAIMEKDESARVEKMKQANEVLDIVQNAKNVNPVVGTVLLVAYKFKELKGRPLIFVNIEDEILAAPKAPTPCIVVVGRSVYEATTFYVVAENIIITSSTDASQALTVLYCLFFVFNMAFPSGLGHTWEFLQRYIYKNNPEEGSKNPKKKVQYENMTARVNSLIRAVMQCNLSELEEEEEIDMN